MLIRNTTSIIRGPQGSILGPLLFIIYINDLSNHAHFSNIRLIFADDTKCYKHITNTTDADLLQQDLESLSKWSIHNQLMFNSTKCVLLKFKSRSSTTTYNINNLTITGKTTHRDLRVMFSVTLQWRTHYENITAKAYKILGLLHKILKNSISLEAKKLLYILLVRSCLSYCSPLWWPYLIQDTILLERCNDEQPSSY